MIQVGSIYINNFTTVTALRDTTEGSVWEFGNSVLEGPHQGGLQILDTAEYYKILIEEVDDKADAGFDISITDLWGRALSFQLINATNGGPSYTWSSIALAENFKTGEIPMPLLVADESKPPYRHTSFRTCFSSINLSVSSDLSMSRTCVWYGCS